MALYNHVAGKDQLIELVALTVQARCEELSLGDDGWEPALSPQLTCVKDVAVTMVLDALR
jgi:hypothetical protein